MTKHWIIAFGILSLEAQAEADFETLGACSGLYEAGGNMARWRAVQGIAEALGRQQEKSKQPTMPAGGLVWRVEIGKNFIQRSLTTTAKNRPRTGGKARSQIMVAS